MKTEYLRKIVCKIKCGTENGTGFLVGENRIITASHVISDFKIENDIRINFYGQKELLANPVNNNWNNQDLVILSIVKNDEVTLPNIYSNEVSEGEQVFVYGFLSTDETPIKADVAISQIWGDNEIDNTTLNLELKLSDERVRRFGGLSGSPIIKDNQIYGVLINQKNENDTAIRLKGIGNKCFKDFLIENNVKYSVEENNVDTLRINDENHTITILNEISNKNKLYFEEIQKELFQKNGIDTWDKLTVFISSLKSSTDSDKNKANYYYLAAIWAHNEGKEDISESYYNQASLLDYELDKRIYLAIKHMDLNEYTTAEKMLSPIDNINILNIFLVCLFNEDKNLSHANTVIDSSGITQNSETQRLLSLFSLKERNFTLANEYINLAMKNNERNYSYQIVKSLILYIEGISNIVNDKEVNDFVIINNSDFIPSICERKLLEESLDILNMLSNESKGTNNYIESLCAKFVVSSVLSNKDINSIIKEIQYYDRINPHAILFSLLSNIKIDEDIKNDFIQSNVNEDSNSVFIVALYELSMSEGNFDKVRELLDSYSERISSFTGLSISELTIIYNIEKRDFTTAQKILKKSKIDANSKKRLEIMINLKHEIAFSKSMIKKLVDFAKTTKKSIDYRNVNLICRKYGFWKEMKANAQNWITSSKEVSALVNLTEALINMGNHQKALKKIEQIELISGVSITTKNLKIHCLAGLSLFQDAIDLAQTINTNSESSALTLFQAKNYFNLGKKPEAISLLKSYAYKYVDKDIYMLLIQSIQGEAPEDAANYAYKLYLEYPNDLEVILFCGNVGVLTGHEELSEKFFSIALQNENNPFQVKTLEVNEAKKLIENARKESFEKYNNLSKGKIPLHAYSDTGNMSMGELLYLQMKYYGLLGNYISNDVKDLNINTSNIVLDYTICYTLSELNLLHLVTSVFDNIYISNKLIPAISSDIQKTYPAQKHLIEKKRLILSKLNEVEFKCINEDEDVSKIINNNYNIDDQVSVYYAEKYNLQYVTERSNGSILKEKVPENWSDYQVLPHEFYYKLKELQIPHPIIQNDEIRSFVIDNLNSHDNILLDEIVLTELLENNSLDGVCAAFDVFIEQHTLHLLKQSIEEANNKENCASRLTSIINNIKELVENKSFLILPYCNAKIQNTGRYMDILIEEINLLAKNKYCLGIDDRLCTQIKLFNNNESLEQKIFNTLDIINLLYKKHTISTIELFAIYDELISKKYCFFVPPVDYILSRLKLAKTCDDGHIIETHQLINIRKYITNALNLNHGVSREHSNYVKNVEIVELIFKLNTIEQEIFPLIFNSKMDRTWMEASASWILMSIGDKMSATLNSEITNSKTYSYKLTSLLTSLLHKKDNYYNEWVLKYINLALAVDDLQIKSIAKDYAKFLCEVIHDENVFDEKNVKLSESDFKNLKMNTILAILKILPVKFSYMVLQQDSTKEFKSRISFNSDLNFSENCYDDFSAELKIENILVLDEDALESAILYVLPEPEIRGKQLLEQLNDSLLINIPEKKRSRMLRFLFELSWYLPASLQTQIYAKKELFTLL